MTGEGGRPAPAGTPRKDRIGQGRRPYQSPRVKAFGRKLPAFAPPSWPENGRPPFVPPPGS